MKYNQGIYNDTQKTRALISIANSLKIIVCDKVEDLEARQESIDNAKKYYRKGMKDSHKR